MSRASAEKGYAMTLDHAVMIFAGCVVLLSVTLGVFVNQWWLALTAFAGFNMIQSSFTGFCPAAILFKALGVKPGASFK